MMAVCQVFFWGAATADWTFRLTGRQEPLAAEGRRPAPRTKALIGHTTKTLVPRRRPA